MERSVLLYIWLAGDFHFLLGHLPEDTPTLGLKNAARLLSTDIVTDAYKYQEYQNNTVFYSNNSEEMYVGGTDFILRLDTNEFKVLETFDLSTTRQVHCQQGSCQNIITVIERFQDALFVCGTNGHRPQCWKLYPSGNNRSNEIVESYEGIGISPFVYSQNSLSLTVEGDIYAAAPLDSDGSSLQFRRKAGSRTNVWMYDNWVSEPTFISASWVKRQNDSENEKIYVFFREKNSDNNPEADLWISRVARVCKVDEGGSKRFFQNMWTSFVKARLVCGFPEESLYFNRLQDIYVLHADDWNETRVYAIFTSNWKSTAVCIYTVGMIEDIFENSTFKGYDNKIPTPRPGTCVRNSKSLPLATINMVKDYPEMAKWVHSVHCKAPFYVSSNNYTKIAVDRVQAADHRSYNVILLATDSGKLHKVLEAGSEPFIISESQLSSHSPILAMKLDTKKKKLVIGFSEKIYMVDLQKCAEYSKSCEDCVLARDPYCAWTTFGCTPTVPGGIQNIMTGKPSVCFTSEEDSKQMTRIKRESLSSSSSSSRLTAVHSVPLDVPFYLTCPIHSYHADYRWVHGDQISPCLQMGSNCLHLIPAMAQKNNGSYQCVSEERDYITVVKEYHLTAQTSTDTQQETREESHKINNASAFAPQVVWLTLGVVLALL